MYLEFYGLKEKPFSLTPNPRFVFHSDRYQAALEHLRYGLAEKEGFMLLTGMVGTGKTTLCRELLEGLDPARYTTALIFNPFLNGLEMLQALLSELGCSYPQDASRKELLDRLNTFLLARMVEGKTCVAIFDEAQHHSAEFLEQIRVLSNLETDDEKLIQIILVGQPELRERIQQPNLAQLDQRVSLRCTLSDLSLTDTERYIYHRLNVAGSQGRLSFTGAAIKLIHRESAGVPRLINLICDRTLLAAFVEQTTKIKPKHVQEGLKSLRGEEGESRPPAQLAGRRAWWRAPVASVAILGLLAALGATYWAVRGIP